MALATGDTGAPHAKVILVHSLHLCVIVCGHHGNTSRDPEIDCLLPTVQVSLVPRGRLKHFSRGT